MFHMYSNPEKVGWLGWFESNGKATAFVSLNRKVTFMWEVHCHSPAVEDDTDITDYPDGSCLR